MDGIGWFTYNTLQYIVRQNPQIEFHFLFDSGIQKEFLFGENVIPHNVFPPAKHAILNVIWFEISVKRILDKIQPDLFLSPDGILCLGWKGKQYGVIHDINFVHRPMDLKLTNRKYYNHYMPKFAKMAARLATVSEYSKQDIHEQFQVENDKIDVVYCGINSFYHPVSKEVVSVTKNQYSNGKNYFVFVGTLSPRKNILGLMKAFEAFKSETGSNMNLLIVGHSMYKTDELHGYKNTISSGKDIVFTGRLEDHQLNNVLASSLALVFVPFFEGFGIPAIEAMQCEVPVIASNVTSVPEVVGDAALLVDPENTNEIKNALILMAADENLRKELIRKGKIRKEIFTWEKTASLLWEGIKKCL